MHHHTKVCCKQITSEKRTVPKQKRILETNTFQKIKCTNKKK